jgi:hypothetical protein
MGGTFRVPSFLVPRRGSEFQFRAPAFQLHVRVPDPNVEPELGTRNWNWNWN